MISRKQGESYEASYTHKSITDINGWGGLWGLYTRIGEAATISGTLSPVDVTLSLDILITNAELETVPVGTYTLIVEIYNDTLGFGQELAEEFQVKTQGIPRP